MHGNERLANDHLLKQIQDNSYYCVKLLRDSAQVRYAMVISLLGFRQGFGYFFWEFR